MPVTRRQLIVAAGAALLGAAVPAVARGRAGAVALVTADAQAQIVVVDPVVLRVLGRIPCAPGPRSIERIGRSGAVVAHTAEGVVSLIDADALRVGAVLRGFRAPRYAAVTGDGRHAHLTDSDAGEVVTIDLRRGRVVRRTDVGGPARHVGLSADGRTLWTALGAKAERIAVLDVTEPTRPRLVRRVTPPFAAHDVAATHDDGRFWVTSGDRGAIAVYDGSASQPRFRLEADAAPQHVAFAAGVAYVASGDDGTLRAHRLGDGRRMWTAAIPTGSYNVTAAEGLVVTPSLSRGTLARVAPGARAARATGVARSAHDVCLVRLG